MHKVLVVEDDVSSAGILKSLLMHNGFKVQWVDTAELALEKIRSFVPDLILLDIGLPGISGMSLCEILKRESKTVALPIIMLTSQNRESSKVQGLKIGADDYLTKPYSEKELMARIEALLRRVERRGVPAKILEAGDIEVDLEAHEARVRGKPVELGPKEFDLLALFVKNKGRVLVFSVISESVWGDDRLVTREDIRFWIHRLREKLGPAADCIETIINQGYKFTA